MQVTETLSEGLKRELRIVVPASELGNKLSTRLDELSKTVTLKGFRPGKVPVAHIKRVFGRSAMAEIVQNTIDETTQKTLADRGERPASQPSVELGEDQGEAEKVLSGDADLAYSMKYEVLPAVALADFKGLKVERPVYNVDDAEIDAELKTLAENARPYQPKDGAAENGDQLAIAYVGKIDGVPFENGADENGRIRLGSGQFIPGFEDQLVGAKTGDQRVVKVTFPADYGAAQLAGKAAEFDVTVKSVEAPGEANADDELAKRLGLDNIEALRNAVRRQVESRYTEQIRQKVKRQVLDQLDETHKFDLPPSMVEQEFDNLWRQVNQELERAGRTFADEKTTEDDARADYRKIAERRVRLGLVLSEIGERNNIAVTEEETQQALTAALRQFPGQERRIYEFYRSNPQALAALRAPIFEEKVVNYILELADVTDKKVTKEELMKEEEEPAKA
jgi:trigger factor